MPLKFRNWHRFQHYRNRTPPWIKLHRALLTDPDYHTMPDRSAKYLPLAWIVASEDSGVLPDCKRLAFILRVAVADIQGMMNDWKPFLECTCDSSMLASCKQLAPVPLCLSVCLHLSDSVSSSGSSEGDAGGGKDAAQVESGPGPVPNNDGRATAPVPGVVGMKSIRASGPVTDIWTVAECHLAAQGIGLGVSDVEEFCGYWNSVSWLDSKVRPVARSWRSLKDRLASWKANKPTFDAERKQREDRAKGGPASAYPESTASLQKRIEAASLELGSMPRKDRDKTAEQVARAASLRERIGAWQKQIAGG